MPMYQWTYKLKYIDYDKDEGEKEVIKSAVGYAEAEAYQRMAMTFPASVDIEEAELLEKKEL